MAARSMYKPGNGWAYLDGGVYEHKPTGVRLSLLGACRLRNGAHVSANVVNPVGWQALKLIKINGGNRKRGLMAWARQQAQEVA